MAKHFIKIFYFFMFILVIPLGLKAQSNDDCLGCHSDASLSMEKNGKTVKLQVKKMDLVKSVHSKMLCVNCHTGYNPSDIPHKKGDMSVNCMDCHSKPKTVHLFHPQMANANGIKGSDAVNCKKCHGTHAISSTKTPESPLNFTNSVAFCGTCHQQEKNDHMQSEHMLQYSANNPNSPTCNFCHQKPITKGYNLDGATLKVNQEKLCLSCHLHNMAYDNQYTKALVNYEKSVHGSALIKGNKNAAVCVDCHGVHKLQKSSKPDSKINRTNVPNVCGSCHKDVNKEYMASIHGKALAKGNVDAPTCSHCHGEHNIQNVPDIPHKVFADSKMNFNTVVNNKMVYCLGCHSDETFSKKYNLATFQKAHDWMPAQESHWKNVRCVDCHSSQEPPNLAHNILAPQKAVKKCEECHAMNSILMNTLYKHQMELARQKYGFINGMILNDAYVIGTTRNIYLNMASVAIFGLTLLGIFGHAGIRYISNKRRRNK